MQRAAKAFHYALVKLGEEAHDRALLVLHARLGNHLLALGDQLLLSELVVLRRGAARLEETKPVLLHFGPIGETHELGEGVEHIRRLGHAVEHQVTHEAQANDLEHKGALSDHEHGQLLLLELGAQSLGLLTICVFADHGDLGVLSLEEVL